MKTMAPALAILTVLSSPVAAGAIDVITAKCLHVDKERTATYVLMWLAGASSDLHRTTVHVADAEAKAARLADYCSRHPRIPLHEALDDLSILD